MVFQTRSWPRVFGASWKSLAANLMLSVGLGLACLIVTRTSPCNVSSHSISLFVAARPSHRSWGVCSAVVATALSRPASSTGYIPGEILVSGTMCVVKRDSTMWFAVERRNHRRTWLEAISAGVAFCNQAARQVLPVGSAAATRASAQRSSGHRVWVVTSVRRCSASILSARAAVLDQTFSESLSPKRKKHRWHAVAEPR